MRGRRTEGMEGTEGTGRAGRTARSTRRPARTRPPEVSRIYVETSVRAGMETLWAHTQEPARHQRWDLRFTEITPLEAPTAPTASGAAPATPGAPSPATRFRYAIRVLPFLTVRGIGVSAGERERPDGERTSALRFTGTHPLCPLTEGSGYWRYVPDGGAVRFLTGYQYRPRWGRPGALLDRLLVRPLMSWATAWSFDRLRLWVDHGVSPRAALLHGLAEAVTRLALLALAAALLLLAGPAEQVVTLLGPFLGLGAVLLTAMGGLLVAALALFVPPLPRTPAARRCLRHPPLRVRAPRLLDTLEHP